MEELFVVTKVLEYLYPRPHCFKLQTFVLQDGWSPLYTSCLMGHLDVVKTLIEAGAIIDQTDKVRTHIATCV